MNNNTQHLGAPMTKVRVYKAYKNTVKNNIIKIGMS